MYSSSRSRARRLVDYWSIFRPGAAFLPQTPSSRHWAAAKGTAEPCRPAGAAGVFFRNNRGAAEVLRKGQREDFRGRGDSQEMSLGVG